MYVCVCVYTEMIHFVIFAIDCYILCKEGGKEHSHLLTCAYRNIGRI